MNTFQNEYNQFKERYHVGSTFANYTNEHSGSNMHEGDKMIISCSFFKI